MLEHASRVANGAWDLPVAFALHNNLNPLFSPVNSFRFANLPKDNEKDGLPYPPLSCLVGGNGVFSAALAVIELFIGGFDEFV